MSGSGLTEEFKTERVKLCAESFAASFWCHAKVKQGAFAWGVRNTLGEHNADGAVVVADSYPPGGVEGSLGVVDEFLELGWRVFFGGVFEGVVDACGVEVVGESGVPDVGVAAGGPRRGLPTYCGVWVVKVVADEYFFGGQSKTTSVGDIDSVVCCGAVPNEQLCCGGAGGRECLADRSDVFWCDRSGWFEVLDNPHVRMWGSDWQRHRAGGVGGVFGAAGGCCDVYVWGVGHGRTVSGASAVSPPIF